MWWQNSIGNKKETRTREQNKNGKCLLIQRRMSQMGINISPWLRCSFDDESPFLASVGKFTFVSDDAGHRKKADDNSDTKKKEFWHLWKRGNCIRVWAMLRWNSDTEKSFLVAFQPFNPSKSARRLLVWNFSLSRGLMVYHQVYNFIWCFGLACLCKWWFKKLRCGGKMSIKNNVMAFAPWDTFSSFYFSLSFLIHRDVLRIEGWNLPTRAEMKCIFNGNLLETTSNPMRVENGNN